MFWVVTLSLEWMVLVLKENSWYPSVTLSVFKLTAYIIITLRHLSVLTQ